MCKRKGFFFSLSYTSGWSMQCPTHDGLWGCCPYLSTVQRWLPLEESTFINISIHRWSQHSKIPLRRLSSEGGFNWIITSLGSVIVSLVPSSFPSACPFLALKKYFCKSSRVSLSSLEQPQRQANMSWHFWNHWPKSIHLSLGGLLLRYAYFRPLKSMKFTA